MFFDSAQRFGMALFMPKYERRNFKKGGVPTARPDRNVR